jgi:hypothetical protein
MSKGWQAFVVVAVASLSVVVLAQENQPLVLRDRTDLTGPQFAQPPTPAPQELRDVMRRNQKVLAVDNLGEGAGGAAGAAGAAGGGAGGAAAAITTFGGTLGKALTPGKEDFDEVLKETPTLKDTFAKINTFFADMKSKGGLEYAQTGQQAVADLEKAAMAKDAVAARKAEIELSVACRNCHIYHRVLLITMPIQFGVVG